MHACIARLHRMRLTAVTHLTCDDNKANNNMKLVNGCFEKSGAFMTDLLGPNNHSDNNNTWVTTIKNWCPILRPRAPPNPDPPKSWLNSASIGAIGPTTGSSVIFVSVMIVSRCIVYRWSIYDLEYILQFSAASTPAPRNFQPGTKSSTPPAVG